MRETMPRVTPKAHAPKADVWLVVHPRELEQQRLVDDAGPLLDDRDAEAPELVEVLVDERGRGVASVATSPRLTSSF